MQAAVRSSRVMSFSATVSVGVGGFEAAWLSWQLVQSGLSQRGPEGTASSPPRVVRTPMGQSSAFLGLGCEMSSAASSDSSASCSKSASP